MDINNLLDNYIIEDIQNPEHPSDFIVHLDHSILILRLPEYDKSNNITVRSYAFVISDNICYLYERENSKFQKIGSLDSLNIFLDQKTDLLIKEIKEYYMEIDELEDSLYEHSHNSNFMSKWLTYKKELSLIYRLIFDAVLTFDLFIKHHKQHSTFEELAYADLYEHMERIKDLAKVALDKLDHLYDFYRAKVDEKMNRNIYYLTLISGIFLPLSLVSGFFGMNTGGLPFVNDHSGTYKATLIAIVLELIIFLPFVYINISNKTKRFKR